MQNRQITTVSRDRRARSYERVAPSTARSQFYYSFARSTRTILRKGSAGTKSSNYYSFARSTRTILRKGCTQHRKIAILLQFRAIDTHDLTKGFAQQVQNRQITTVWRDRRVRSYERDAPAGKKSLNYYSFARSTRTILQKVARAGKKLSNYYSFARSTRTILRKGCISASIFRTMAAPPYYFK